jgi:hypothetical protein
MAAMVGARRSLFAARYSPRGELAAALVSPSPHLPGLRSPPARPHPMIFLRDDPLLRIQLPLAAPPQTGHLIRLPLAAPLDLPRSSPAWLSMPRPHMSWIFLGGMDHGGLDLGTGARDLGIEALIGLPASSLRASMIWHQAVSQQRMDCRCFSEVARSSLIYSELRAPPS